MQSAPDGHTILFSASTAVGAHLVMSKAPYGPLTDFSYVARIGEAPMLIVMAPDRASQYSRRRHRGRTHEPEQVDRGHGRARLARPLGNDRARQCGELQADIIPYRGTAPALNDIAGGHVQLYIDAMVALLPTAQSDKIKAGAERTSTLSGALARPRVGTMKESPILFVGYFPALAPIMAALAAMAPSCSLRQPLDPRIGDAIKL